MDSPTSRLMSGYRRHMVRLTEKPTMANTPSRSPERVGSPTELDTIAPIPPIVMAMAMAIFREMRSLSQIQALTAANSGTAATMATTLAIRVWVTAITKQS